MCYFKCFTYPFNHFFRLRITGWGTMMCTIFLSPSFIGSNRSSGDGSSSILCNSFSARYSTIVFGRIFLSIRCVCIGLKLGPAGRYCQILWMRSFSTHRKRAVGEFCCVLSESAGENMRSRFAGRFYFFISPASKARFIENLVVFCPWRWPGPCLRSGFGWPVCS